MKIFIAILVIIVVVGSIWLNHRGAKKAMEGVTFVIAYPPTAVAAAIDRAHNQGTIATLQGSFSGISVLPLGPSGFATNTRMGDNGEISISRDPAGTLVTARALSLYVGMPPRQLSHNRGIWGLSVSISHGIYRMLGITPGSARMNRWQNGLEGRINRTLAKATR